MRKPNLAAAAAALVLAAPLGVAPAHAAVTVYTDRAAFEAALTSFTVETFDDATLVPGLSIANSIYNSSDSFINLGAGRYHTSTGRTAVYNESGQFTGYGDKFTRLAFGGPVTAFGVDLRHEYSYAMNLFIDDAATPSAVEPGGSTGTRFYDFIGVISDEAFSTVTLRSPTVGTHFRHEGMVLDNVTFAPLTSAVPEPATWAMMIAGFGLAGATLRRRRVALDAA